MRRQFWLACAAALAATHAFMAPATRAAAPPRRAERTVVQGIPKMFRWLTDQYPSIMERVSDGLPAPNSKEAAIDNLYLDMNGIIHMCTHANDPARAPRPTPRARAPPGTRARPRP